MAYVAVEKVLRLPPVCLGVGETASTRVTVHHTFRMERLSIVLPWSRISGLLRASDIRHLDVVSVKIGSDEQLDAPMPAVLFLPSSDPVHRSFWERAAMPGEVITVTVRDHGRSGRTALRMLRQLLLHRQRVTVLIGGAEIEAQPEIASFGQVITGLFGARRTTGRS